MSVMFALAIFAYLLICVVFALIRGVSKARIRTLTVLFSAVAAVVTALIVKQFLLGESFFNDVFVPLLQSFEDTEDILEMFQSSPVMLEVAMGMVAAVTMPLLCLVFFILYCVLTWIVYFIVTLIIRRKLKESTKRTPHRRLRAALLGLAQGLIVLFIIMIPVSGYIGLANDSAQLALATGELDDAGEVEEKIVEIFDSVEALNGAPALHAVRFLGVDAVNGLLTSFDVQGETVNLSSEMEYFLVMIEGMDALTQADMSDFDEQDAEALDAIADSFEGSKIIPAVMSEFIYNATDAWLDDESYMGIRKPAVGDDDLFTPLMDEIILILNTDAKDKAALKADISTLAEMFSIFAEKEVFKNVDDVEKMVQKLGAEGVIEDVITTLGENSSMKRLIPQITNLGIRSIGEVLGLPDNDQANYDKLLKDIADATNKAKALEEAEQIPALSKDMKDAFDDAGVVVDASVVDFYAAALLQDMKGKDEVYDTDVRAFFVLYSSYSTTDADQVQAEGTIDTLASTAAPNLDVILNNTPYEEMSEDERKASSVAAAAQFALQFAALTNDASFDANLDALIEESFAGMDADTLSYLKSLNIKKPISSNTVTNVASLTSSTEMQSSLITMNELLLDVAATASKINSGNLQSEAKAIAAIFAAAGDITNLDEDDMKLEDMAGILGEILDSLKQSLYGGDRTANLFKAVFQAPILRDTIGMDISTATQMANKATTGDVNYTQTLTSVSKSVDVIATLKDENGKMEEEDLVKVIQDLTPQTAGMMEVYITPDRMTEYGAPEGKEESSAQVMTSIFSYMGNEDIEDYDAEAKALNQLMGMATSAKNDDSDKMFSSEGTDDGRLPTEKETVANMMNSKATIHALKENMTDENGDLTDTDPFGVNLTEESPEDAESLTAAIHDYKNENPDADEESLILIGAAFGVDIAF